MLTPTVRQFTLASALSFVALVAQAGTVVAQPATAQNPSSSVSPSLDFPAFASAKAQTTCDGKPLPLFQESSDPTYALCVEGRLRRINPNDRVAYSVKLTDASLSVGSQFTLVSPVGRPVVDNVRTTGGYLVQTERVQPATNTAHNEGNAGTFEFNTLGRTADGKLVVRVRLFQETLAAQQQTYTLADGETVASEDGQVLKATRTAELLPGQAVTFTEGGFKLELSVRPVPNL